MYDYGMVKSIHDQRMRQFTIEAERSHLLRMLRQNRRRSPVGSAERMVLRVRGVIGRIGAGVRSRQLST